MAKDKLTRRLTAIFMSIAMIISMCAINLDTVYAKVLVDNSGSVILESTSDTTKAEGTVDIAATSKTIFSNLRFYLNGFTGIALITLTLAFVIKCAELGASADNAMKRGNSITGLLWVGIAIGLLGAFNTVMSILAVLTKGI